MRKIIGLFIVSMLISCLFIPVINSMENMNIISNDDVDIEDKQIADVYIRKYDPVEKTFYKELVKQITAEDALLIREELLSVQENFENSEEIISNQFEVMHKWGLLDPAIDFDYFEQLLNSNYNKFANIDFPSISTDVTLLGPSFVSFLTIGSIIFPLHMLFWDMLKPIWWNATKFNYDAMGGSSILAQLFVSPALAIYSSTMTFINSFGFVIGPKFILSPFVSILMGVLGLGITVNIYMDSFAMNVFDWSAGICIAGMIAYISQIQP